MQVLLLSYLYRIHINNVVIITTGLTNKENYMIIQLEASITSQADTLYISLSQAVHGYIQGLKDLGYVLLKGGSHTELQEEWSLFCHPHYSFIIDVLNLDLSLLSEEKFIEVISKYYDSKKEELPDNILLPNPQSNTFSTWDVVPNQQPTTNGSTDLAGVSKGEDK